MRVSLRAWPKAGVHEISYIAQSTDGTVVSRWSDTTNITEEEPIETSVRKGYKVPFSAPSGYSQVTWTLDGKLVSEKQLDRSDYDTQVLTFRRKGKHILTCLARGSENGDFRRIIWAIRVN